jgi:undecaprenyl-diphosphatase
VPAVVLSGLFELSSIIEGEEGEHVGAGALVVATAFAFVVGYASIAFLLRFLANHTLFVFVAYRIVLGVIVLALAGAGTID